MAILKLQNAGDEHTMTITECIVAKGNYGEQVKFNDGTDLLYLPKDTADRQLQRLGLDGHGSDGQYDAVIGMTLTFSRDPNPKPGSKPYWGISYAGTEAPKPKASPRVEPTKPTAPSTTVTLQQRREAMLSQYLMLYQTVGSKMIEIFGVPDAAAIQAATATIWISWKDKGIQPDGLPEAKAVEKAPEVKMPAPSGKRITPPTAHPSIDLSNFPPERDEDSDLPF